MRFFCFVRPCPVLCCFAVLLCGETQIWLGDLRVVVVCGGFLFFVCRCFRDDLPKFLDHTCPCTFLLFTAYAIVRTEPSANRPNRREKKMDTAISHFASSNERMLAANSATPGCNKVARSGRKIEQNEVPKPGPQNRQFCGDAWPYPRVASMLLISPA